MLGRMSYAVIVLLSVFCCLEAAPLQRNLLLKHNECEFYADNNNLIACYDPADAEQLHTWIINDVERNKVTLDDLTSLQLFSATPHKVLQEGLNYLPNFKHMFLQSVKTDIPANTFAKLPSLVELQVFGGFDTKLYDKALAGLTNLKKCWLTATSSFNVKRVLKEVPSLTHIRIGSNVDIKTIEEDDFEGVPNLQELRIYHTKVSEIKPGALKNLKKLVLVNIGASKEIRSLDDDIFQGLQIKTLDLAANSFISVPSLFGLEETLEDLDLSYNNIENIDKTEFVGFKKLKKLDLSNNKISVVPKDAFKDLTALEKLDLSRNNIDEIKNGAFANLITLHVLNLKNNNLKELSVDVFPEPNNLEELYLGNNQIVSVDGIRN